MSRSRENADYDGNNLLLENDGREQVFISGFEIINFDTELKIKVFISSTVYIMIPFSLLCFYSSMINIDLSKMKS